VYGLTAKSDTITAAYVMIKGTQIAHKDVPFKQLNSSENAKGSFYTFELVDLQTINEIGLKFTNQDFDWKVQLEGSQNQKEWFTILEDYRIVSMHQNDADFEYTQLKFPDAKYRFYRLLVKDVKVGRPMTAFLSKQTRQNIAYKEYQPKSILTKVDKKNKQTIIDIELNQPVPVGSIKMDIKNQFSFHRPTTVFYANDSLQNEKGWQYQYVRLTTDMLHTKKDNELSFQNVILRKLRIIIDNQDNPPLDIGDIVVKGQPVKMLIRFTEPADYYLVYGRAHGRAPSFDIAEDVLPAYWSETPVGLGPEQVIKKEAIAPTKPLFENKIWLWVVMGLIILLLGWFSLKMMNDG